MEAITRRDKWSVIFLILAVLIAVAAFFIGSNLEKRVNELATEREALIESNEELRAVSESLEAINSELEESNRLLADERESLQGQVEAGRYEISLAAKSQADLIRAILGEREFRDWIRPTDCEGFFAPEPNCEFDLEYSALLDLRQDALIKRSVAQSSADFAELRQIYKAISDKIERMARRGIWSSGRRDYSDSFAAFALEGRAYASYKLGETDLAKQLILAAIPNSRGSAATNLTYFKILCSQQADAAVIRNAVAIARRVLDGRLEKAKTPIEQKVARINRAHLEQDSEMIQECAYAELNTA